MKALVYTGPHALEVRDEPEPVPGPGEVLVRVEAVGICGSDMHAYHGHDSRRPAPLILGHEAAGRIASGPRAGTRVTINPLVVDPACPYAVEGRWHLSPTRQIISMPPRQGGVRGAGAHPGAQRRGHPRRHADRARGAGRTGRGVLARGAPRHGAARPAAGRGPRRRARRRAIGLGAALVARLFGAGDIRVAEPNPLRRQAVARGEGLDAYDPSGPAAPAESSVDLVIDAVGAAATRAAACAMVRPGGVIVHAGLLPGHEGLDVRKITLQEITLTGTYCYTPTDFTDAVEALASGRLGRLGWFETRPLAGGAAAFRDIDAGAAPAKLVLTP